MERNCEIDIMKGLCILTIVFYHTGHPIIWFGYVFLYGFYYVAGYTFKDKPFWEFLKLKVHRIYFSFIIANLFGVLVIKGLSKITDYYIVDYNKDGNLGFIYIIKCILSFCYPCPLMGPSWFLFPLFLILIIFCVLNKVIKNNYIILGCTFMLFTIGNIYYLEIRTIQWNNCAYLLNICYGLFLFSCGYTMKKYKYIEELIFNGKYSTDIYIVSIIILFQIWRYSGFSLDLRSGNIINHQYNVLAYFIGMYFLIFTSKLLSEWGGGNEKNFCSIGSSQYVHNVFSYYIVFNCNSKCSLFIGDAVS